MLLLCVFEMWLYAIFPPFDTHNCVSNGWGRFPQYGVVRTPLELDLSFYLFILMGTMFPIITYVFGPSVFPCKVHFKLYIYVYTRVLPPGSFVMNSNIFNYCKFKYFFLLNYCSEKFTTLSKGFFVII